MSTKEGKDFNQKEINELSKLVEESRLKVSDVVAQHTTLEDKLDEALKSGGKLTEPQKSTW
jgi:hypothetical protein